MLQRLSRILAMYLCACSTQAFTDSFVFFDVDNVTFETRQIKGGTFDTAFKVFRVSQRTSTIQPNLPEKAQQWLSSWDFKRLRGFLARDSNTLGSVKFEAALQDGDKFKPGYYTLRNPETFERYMEATGRSTKGYFLEDIEAAYARDPDKKFLGPLWHLIKARFSDAETAKVTGFISARGHSVKEWIQGFKLCFSNEAIPFLPDPKNIHAVSRSEYDKFEVGTSIPLRKRAVLEQIAYDLARRPLTEKDQRLAIDGPGTERVHVLAFFDDNQETIARVTELFERLAMTRQYPIKFVIGNLGLSTDIRASRRPQFYVVLSNGGFRPAKESEVLGEPYKSVLDTLHEGNRECRAYLHTKGKSNQ